jgi:peptide/nickel transport system permease protein
MTQIPPEVTSDVELATARTDDTDGARGSMPKFLRLLLARVAQLVVLLFSVSTLLFFLLRFTGSPATTLAGENATPAQVAEIKHLYGLDQPLFVQYLKFIIRAARLNFGLSIDNGQPALHDVLHALPATLSLAGLAICIELIIAIPLGAWLGSRPDGKAQIAVSPVVFVSQGVPGFVVGLVLIQVFAVKWHLLPSVGNAQALSYVLPSATLAAFLVPRLTRVLSSNVALAMRQEYIATALANGASRREIVLRHALPNALLGATALVGGQLAALFSGALITEQIFAWPGTGQLMVNSVRQLDFPVIEAAVFVIAALVFIANTLTDLMFSVVDPRLRGQRA